MEFRFNKHDNLKGLHSLFGGSKYAWLRYDDDKLYSSAKSDIAAQKGTELHALAKDMIEHKIHAAPLQEAFYLFVNDCIGFNMRSEQPLYYSWRCFGTADAISFRSENGVDTLRIFDLKNGRSRASFDQLYIYAALFCLEYDMKPSKINFILRIYQGKDFKEDIPSSDTIAEVMDKIVHASNIADQAFKDEEF